MQLLSDLPDTLPNKLSDLIMLALNDLQKCKADPRYEINMMEWHAPYHNTCYVCFAGAVMAQSLNVSPKKQAFDTSFSDSIMKKMRALNYVRCGEVEAALDAMGHGSFDWEFETFYSNPDQFVATMTFIAEKLKEGGL